MSLARPYSPWLLIALLTSLAALPGCATKRAKGKHASANASSSVQGEVAMTEEEEGDEGGDEEDEETADTELEEGTPTDLGDVAASDKRDAEEIRADQLARKTFPLVDNEFVQQWIRYFTGRGRVHFKKWLERSPRYRPLIQKVMQEEGLPDDLVYLAMIESGFNPKARSHAKAVGPWQFIKSTGQRYGLEVDSWIDERRDIEKSTHAAAAYLKELHQIFGSWYLAAASYNAGEGKVLNAIRKDRSRDFWELARAKKNFRPETRNYVPKIIAAAMLTKDPDKYGFTDVEYEAPLQWESCEVGPNIDLRSISDVSGVPVDTLRLMNAELKRSRTPPTKGNYTLKVPVGKSAEILASMDKIKARKYAVEAEESPRRRRCGARRKGSKPEAPLAAGQYRVEDGDTLWDIARRHKTSVDEIKRLNGINSPKELRDGKVLKVPGAAGSPQSRRPVNTGRKVASTSTKSIKASKAEQYKVRPGDTLIEIAERHGTSVAKLKRLNKPVAKRGLQSGQTIRLR